MAMTIIYISSCYMDNLNKIFNFVSLSYASAGPGREREWKLWDREWKLREWDGSGIDHCGTGTGRTAAGTGWDQEQRTSPVQNSISISIISECLTQAPLSLCPTRPNHLDIQFLVTRLQSLYVYFNTVFHGIPGPKNVKFQCFPGFN